MRKFFTPSKLAIIFDLLVIFALALLPFNWLKDGQLILGHDAGIPLNPLEHFKDRLFVWTNIWGIGNDQGFALGALFFHGLEGLTEFLGFSLQRGQQLTFVFWLLLPGLTMYYFTRSFFSTRRYLPLIASVFFMLNHFLLQGWFIVERTKFSTYAVMPLILLFIFRLFEGKISAVYAGILTALTVSILNGGGSIPLFGALFVLVPLSILYLLFFNFSLPLLKKIGIYVFTGISFGILFSFFWLLPYVNFLLRQFSIEVNRAGGVDGVIGWAKTISVNSSFLNLMRLQGIPNWYNNPFHPYANVFLNNPLLIIVSFLLPVLAFGSWFIVKKKKERLYILFFMLVALFGMFFSAGLHPPTGFIYELMIRTIPGFMVFRTPFYKFAPLIWFAFSLLIGFTLDEFLQRLKGFSSKLARICALAVIIFIVLYNFPFIDGRFFVYEKDRTTRLTVPQYIFDFQKWANSLENKNVRSLLFPKLLESNKLQTYDWGYFSLIVLTSLLSRESFLTNSPYTNENENTILDGIYENVLNNEPGWERIARMMGIKNFIVQEDYKWDVPGIMNVNPKAYEPALDNSPEVYLNKVFGAWRMYSFKDEEVNSLINTSNKITYTEGEPYFLRYLSSLPSFDYKSPIYFMNSDDNNTSLKDKNYYLNLSSNIYLLPKCITCNTANFPLDADDYKEPLLLPGSQFYQIVLDREKKIYKEAVDLYSKTDFLLKMSYRRLREMQRMIDFKINKESLDQPLIAHYELMKELDDLLIDPGMFESEKDNNLLIRIESYLDIQRRLLENYFAKIETDEKIINNSYIAILSVYNKVKAWSWRTRNEQDKRYIITVDSPGIYKLWLRIDKLGLPLNIDPLEISFKFTIDGVSYDQKPEKKEGIWLLLKSLDLNKGLHKMIFRLEPPELFDKGSFLTIGDNLYQLKPSGQQGERECLIFPVENLVAGATYRVSFQHQGASGNPKMRVVLAPKEKNILPLSTAGVVLENDNFWDDFESDIQLLESNELLIYICTELYPDPIFARNDLIGIKNISVRKLSSPILIYEKENINSYEATGRPDIKFDKINQTKYKISIKKAARPFFLTFLQRFSPDWKIYFDDGSKYSFLPSVLSPSGFFSLSNLFRQELPEENHISTDGYANAWFIEKTGDYNLILEYKPQLLRYIAIIISLLSFAAALIIIVLIKRKEHYEK